MYEASGLGSAPKVERRCVCLLSGCGWRDSREIATLSSEVIDDSQEDHPSRQQGYGPEG
jgi:hypothetical protein